MHDMILWQTLVGLRKSNPVRENRQIQITNRKRHLGNYSEMRRHEGSRVLLCII